ncbi:hypothetical protein ABPG74_013675 [Tetrahymena malaccensis]
MSYLIKKDEDLQQFLLLDFSAHKSLKLDLKKSQIKDEGIKQLAIGLETCVNNLYRFQIIMDNTKFEIQSIQILFQKISICKNLQILKVSLNQLDFRQGAYQVGKQLALFENLINLDIEFNQSSIDSQAAAQFCEEIGKIQKLEILTLDFYANQIKENFALNMSSGLSLSKKLFDLSIDLRFNQLQDQGMQAFGIGLKKCKYVKVLALQTKYNSSTVFGNNKLIQNILKMDRLVVNKIDIQ